MCHSCSPLSEGRDFSQAPIFKQYVAIEMGLLALVVLLQVASCSALGRYVHTGNPGSTVAQQDAREPCHSVQALSRYCVSLWHATASGVCAFVPLTTALVTRGPRAVVPELEFAPRHRRTHATVGPVRGCRGGVTATTPPLTAMTTFDPARRSCLGVATVTLPHSTQRAGS